MGLFPDQNINWYQKLTCDDPKPSLSFCLPIVATVAKGRGKSIISFDGCHAPPALWVCSTSSFVDLLPKAPQGKSKSSARLKKNKKKYFIYIFQKTPRWKNCSKLGVARDCHALPLSWWWLTDWGPRVSKWWWVWILTQIDTGSQFPRGESPPRQPPPPPYGRGRGHRTHQEALTVFVVNLWNTISMLLTTGTPHSRMIQVRPEKTLYYILFYLYSLRLVPNGYFIRDTSSITRY